jgi:(p)ppGpp synthase/HD superfamily hydrolase
MVERAEALAERAHREKGQVRKFTGEPYIVHPGHVAEIVASVTSDPVMIAAAWLHDVVEDTDVTLEEVEREFGPEVAEIVDSVTKVVDGTKIGRARAALINIEHASHGSPAAKTVKLADVIDNVSDILEHDREFARVYLMEKKMLMEHLHEGDPALYGKATELLELLMEELDRDDPLS